MADKDKMVKIDELRKFTVGILEKLDVPTEDAEITADNLIASDRRGIPSHGVARLKRYVDGLKDGMMVARPDIKVVKEGPSYALIDGGGGLGQVVGSKAMNVAIDKARDSGLAFVTTRNSNHYGIAGYYSMMALKEGLLGISMTNSAPLVVPTFSKEIVLGTNPLSVAVPAKSVPGVVIDMATSTVPRGKLEVYARMEKQLPLFWATDETGKPTPDPKRVLENLLARKGGGLLPLGGADEEHGSHKGYCLSFMVDILSGVLSGGEFGKRLYAKGKTHPSGIGHFFGCIDIETFRPLDEFKSDMDEYIKTLKDSEKAEGAERIYIPGEKEFAFEDNYKDEVPINEKVYSTLRELAGEYGLEFKL